MSKCVYSCSGGGIRGGAVFGAQLAAKHEGKWHPEKFDSITGDSFGALEAALTANGWTPEEKIEFFVSTYFPKLFTRLPWSIRQSLSLIKPLSLEGVAKKIDKLGLKSSPKLFINTWDIVTGRQIIYCEKKPDWFESDKYTVFVENAFNGLGFGTVITRSMALPGLIADDYRYIDGGISEHPPLSFIPKNHHILMITLGYAGLLRPIQKGFVERAFYAYEVKSKLFMEKCLSEFTDIYVVNPKIYDISSLAFNLTKEEKKILVQRGYENTLEYWQNYNISC